MINVVYLVLVFSGSNGGMMTSQLIPQANMKQCEINMNSYNDVSHRGIRAGYTTRAHCIVGVK